jgi:hypothetical protein
MGRITVSPRIHGISHIRSRASGEMAAMKHVDSGEERNDRLYAEHGRNMIPGAPSMGARTCAQRVKEGIESTEIAANL